MDDEARMNLSLALGAPVDGLLEKMANLGPVLDHLFDLASDTPREQMVLLGLYTCVTLIRNSVDDKKHEAVEEYAKVLPEIQLLLGDLASEFYAEHAKRKGEDDA